MTNLGSSLQENLQGSQAKRCGLNLRSCSLRAAATPAERGAPVETAFSVQPRTRAELVCGSFARLHGAGVLQPPSPKCSKCFQNNQVFAFYLFLY